MQKLCEWKGKPGRPRASIRRFERAATRIYPQLADTAWQDAWGGRFALTVDHLPHIHQPDDGLFIAIGCNGRGIAMMSQIGSSPVNLVSASTRRPAAAAS